MDSVQSYVYRGQKPKPLPQPGPKRVQSAAGHRLSTILETGSARQGGPRTSTSNHGTLTNQPTSRSSQHGIPPRLSEDKRPPSYATQYGDEEKEPGRFQRLAMRRGGWKRLAVIICIAIFLLVAIALGVGLGVGLSKKSSSSKNSSNPSTSTPTPSNPTGPFPAGAYAITAFLTSTSTACVTNAATWTCPPYQLYSSSPTGSEAAFDWVITQKSSKSSSSFVISSANNSLSTLPFTNATLALEDEGTSTERYTFSMPDLIKNVIPTVSLSDDGATSTCFYNTTTLRASLYTKMNATLTDSSGAQPSAAAMTSDMTSQAVSFNEQWPGAVMIEQVVTAGDETPACYRLRNGASSGDRLDVPTESGSSQCSCVYMNYGSGS